MLAKPAPPQYKKLRMPTFIQRVRAGLRIDPRGLTRRDLYGYE